MVRTSKTPTQLDREIRQALSRSPWHSHATANEAAARAEQLDREIAPDLGRTRAAIVRAINAIVRAADGRNVYLTSRRLGEDQVQRITQAHSRGRGMEVRSLATGRWLPVMPELGDKIDVR